MILAGLGRYGPYLQKGKTYANLPGIDDVFEIGLNRAVSVLEEKKNNPRGAGRTQRAPLKEVGEHPDSKKPVRVLEGRFGAYVSDGTTHATLPKGMDPQALTMDEAVSLLAAREGKGGGKKKKASAKAKPKPEPKAPAKVKAAPKAKAAPKKKAAAAKKPAAKKTAAKAK
jgi:DNA topoisomerase-1